jgi:multiple sugar transport system permease protein
MAAHHRAYMPWLYVGPAMLVMAVACLYPVLSAFQLSLFDWNMGTPWSSARWVGLSNFVSAFTNPRVWSSLQTTLLFAAVCVTVEMLLGIALALALEKPVRGTAAFRTMFILPMMIAPVAVGLTWRYMFDAQFGLINALLKVVGFSAQNWLAEPGLAFVDPFRLYYDGGSTRGHRLLGDRGVKN